MFVRFSLRGMLILIRVDTFRSQQFWFSGGTAPLYFRKIVPAITSFLKISILINIKVYHTSRHVNKKLIILLLFIMQ